VARAHAHESAHPTPQQVRTQQKRGRRRRKRAQHIARRISCVLYTPQYTRASTPRRPYGNVQNTFYNTLCQQVCRRSNSRCMPASMCAILRANTRVVGQVADGELCRSPYSRAAAIALEFGVCLHTAADAPSWHLFGFVPAMRVLCVCYAYMRTVTHMNA